MAVGGDGVGDVVLAQQDDQRGVVLPGQRAHLLHLVVAAEDGHAAGLGRVGLRRETLRELRVWVVGSVTLLALKSGWAVLHVELKLHIDAGVHHGDFLQPGATRSCLIDDNVSTANTQHVRTQHSRVGDRNSVPQTSNVFRDSKIPRMTCPQE